MFLASRVNIGVLPRPTTPNAVFAKQDIIVGKARLPVQPVQKELIVLLGSTFAVCALPGCFPMQRHLSAARNAWLADIKNLKARTAVRCAGLANMLLPVSISLLAQHVRPAQAARLLALLAKQPAKSVP